MSDNKKTTNEEVDLGQLFILIGNMFSNLFKLIGKIFRGLFKGLIYFLIYFNKRIKWYIPAITIGLLTGYILDNFHLEKLYGANAYVEPNFQSARQLYENINNLHQLADKDKDSVELANLLDLTVKEAATLKGFYISPDIAYNDLMIRYVEYKNEMDSVSRLNANFDEFVAGQSYYMYKLHAIGVSSTDKFIFEKLQKKLVEVISRNSYLEEVKDVALNNLEMEKLSLDKQIHELDSLTKEYFKIRVTESKKDPVIGSGTNLFLGEGQNDNGLLVDESFLLKEKYKLEQRKRQIDQELIEQQEVVNIISDFPKSGYEVKKVTEKMLFILPVVFFGMLFLGFLGMDLKKYLDTKDKEWNS